MKKIIFFLFVISFLFPISVFATITETDSNPTTAEVQTLVDNATAGDTIKFMGDATWTAGVTIDKAITINGNGKTLTSSGNMGTTGFFNITGFTASTLVRITGFTFQMTNWTPTKAIYVHDMTGGVNGGLVRIDNNTFHHGSSAIIFYHMKGLIDNNYFYNQDKSIDLSAGSRANADASWASLAAGTADAIFIESNYFISNANFTGSWIDEVIGTENGGKLVVRYNQFNSDNIPTAISNSYPYTPLETHGNASGGCGTDGYWQIDSCPRRGQSVVEFYNNTASGRRIDYFLRLRGSANLIHNNAINGTVANNPRIYFREEEYYETSNWVPSRTAWPAEDQVHNTFIWNNTYRSHDFNDGVYGYVESERPQSAGLLKDRDFFLHAPCASGDSTDAYGFTCTHGKSTFSNLNDFTDGNGGSNSYPGDGTSYVAHGTMAFTNTGDNAYYGYTPYTYPHPLRGVTATHSGVSISGMTMQ